MNGPEETGVERRFRGEAHRWDQIYSEGGGPLARAWDRLTRGNVRQRFSRTFELAGDLRGRSVLDLGCGTGRYLVEAAHRGAERIVGVDFAPEMIDTARQRVRDAAPHAHIELVCTDLARFVQRDRFDLVIANGLFDYLPDPRDGMARAVSWTGGLLVATFPDRAALRALPRRLWWAAHGVRIQLFTRDGIGALAIETGLAEVSVDRLGPIFLLAARRD